MSTLEEVCLLSCEKRIDSFPNEIPEHKFSEKHKKEIKELLDSSSDKSKFKLSKNTIRFLLIAAILLIIAATAIANPLFKEFTINKFSNHSEYGVADKGNYDYVDSPPILNYIPEGFALIDNEYIEHTEYANDDMNFSVTKYEIDTEIAFDTEMYPSEIIEISGIKAVYYKADDIFEGIIFNNGKYIYSVNGNIGKDELVKIAQNIG